MKLYLVLFFTIILPACDSHSDTEFIKSKRIGVCLLGTFDTEMKSFLIFEISKFYGCKVVSTATFHLPQTAWYAPRKRYRADSLIAFLKSNKPDSIDILVGLTTVDISASVGNHADWGVFGLGFQPGPSSIISSARLNKDNPSVEKLRSRLKNVVLHEIGHNLGLLHCPDENCLMKDAAGKLESVEGTMRTMCIDCHKKIFGY